ncbi:MAG: hypothetical protein M3Y72_00985 [Acidobacteriota bacterium]|nr:hypothetical protein [Acidobacteriota bacterium]
MTTKGSVWGRSCWIIDSSHLRVTVLESGGHIAAITLQKGPNVNPLLIQSRPTIDSDQFDPKIHGPIYGNDSEAKLISGLAGHNLCLPFWGDPTPAEYAAGMTFHGESNIVRWSEIESTTDSLTVAAVLPESRLELRRYLECAGTFLRVQTTVENLTAWDRPIAWCEHVTLGAPFVEPGVTQFRATATRGFQTGFESGTALLWPSGRGEIDCNLETFSANPHRDLVNSFLLDTKLGFSRFSAYHPHHRLLLGYVFRRSEFPWLNIWENHDSRMLTRGMEFSNTPRHGTMRKLIQTPTLWGVPVYDWIDARGKLTKSFTAFLEELPAGG